MCVEAKAQKNVKELNSHASEAGERVFHVAWSKMRQSMGICAIDLSMFLECPVGQCQGVW